MGHQRVKCPDCGAGRDRLKVTGLARGSYDESVQVRCGVCGREWFSGSPVALKLLRRKRESEKN